MADRVNETYRIKGGSMKRFLLLLWWFFVPKDRRAWDAIFQTGKALLIVLPAWALGVFVVHNLEMYKALPAVAEVLLGIPMALLIVAMGFCSYVMFYTVGTVLRENWEKTVEKVDG